MTTQLLESIDGTIAWQDPFRLRAAIIYEDAATGIAAKYRLDRLSEKLGLESESLEIRFWGFELLTEAGRRSAAAREASDFDIIIFSLRSAGEPPLAVKQWLQEWLTCRNRRPCALAALVNGAVNQVENTPLAGYLGRIAEVSGLDLVFPFGEVAGQSTGATAGTWPSSVSPTGPMADQWQAYPQWGINE